MSVRLQVILDDEEMAEIRQIANRKRMTVSEWVRQALRAARREEPRIAANKKLALLEAALHRKYPTADIEDMLHEIEVGRETGSAR
jgi:hypothetical protein